MNSTPILSIAIPTKSRYKYLKGVLDSLLRFSSNLFEVVIQDNSENNTEFLSYLSENPDSRIKYFYSNDKISAVHNFNRAIENSRGDYICIIGDDDGVCPEIIELAKWSKRNGLDAVTWKDLLFYSWPGFHATGKLTILPFSGNYEKVKIENELQKFLTRGGIYFAEHRLVRAYHGLVKRELLEIVKRKTNHYIGGLSPDIYASITLSIVAKNVMFFDYPFTIGGASAEARGAHGKSGKKNMIPMKEAPHLRARGEYEWSSRIPYLYSGETLWAESADKAFVEMGRDDLANQVSKYTVCGIVECKYPDYYKELLAFLVRENKSGALVSIKARLYYSKNMFRLREKLKWMKRHFLYLICFKLPVKFLDIKDINHANDVLAKYKHEKGTKLEFE